MSRPLPAISSTVGAPIPVGHINDPEGYVAGFDYRALLVSEPHFRLKGGAWSGGGPFYQESAKLTHTGGFYSPRWSYYGNHFGPTRVVGVGSLAFRTIPAYATQGADVGRSRASAITLLKNLQSENYAKGINRTRPGSSGGSLGTFIGELRDFPKAPGLSFLQALRGVNLRDVIPYVRKRANYFLGLAAGEYINDDFGWTPFLADLRSLYRISRRIDASLARLIAENDKNIRRRVTLGTSTVVVEKPYWHNLSVQAPAYNCGGYGALAFAQGQTHLTATTRTTTNTWFVAGYRYYIKDTSSWLWKGRAVATLFGAFPTPELVWNLTPWSWLVDYYADLGEIFKFLSPASAVDALSTRYAFTMRHTISHEEWVASTTVKPPHAAPLDWEGGNATLRSVLVKETKQRGAGWAPFGTSLNPPALSARQIGVLAALGISRATPR